MQLDIKSPWNIKGNNQVKNFSKQMFFYSSLFLLSFLSFADHKTFVVDTWNCWLLYKSLICVIKNLSSFLLVIWTFLLNVSYKTDYFQTKRHKVRTLITTKSRRLTTGLWPIINFFGVGGKSRSKTWTETMTKRRTKKWRLEGPRLKQEKPDQCHLLSVTSV